MERLVIDQRPLLDAFHKTYGADSTIESLMPCYGANIGYWSFYIRVAN